MMQREAVLAAIREKQGQWVSGGALSKELGVSRTAVWKQVKILQAEGYAIETSPKKGYRLTVVPDILSAAEVVSGLQTQVLGRENYFYFAEIDSTNNHAKELAAKNSPEGTIVVAERQTAGRGRRGRAWHSQPGQGIYMSLIMRPPLSLNQLSRVTPSIAVAVAETLEKQLDLKPGIKWPNDVLINGRKIAGILTEAVTDMDGIEYIIIGIGLNVNQRVEDFPEEFRDAVTSTREEVKHPVSRVKLLQELLLQLEKRYRQLTGGEFSLILERFRELSVVIGRDIKLDSVNGVTAGRAIDIDNNGFLTVRDVMGNIHNVMSGEIFLKAPRDNHK
jgi:BirA family biotin operon repressor/biotin-[acetyl-CoA-carboxylase] ligase